MEFSIQLFLVKKICIFGYGSHTMNKNMDLEFEEIKYSMRKYGAHYFIARMVLPLGGTSVSFIPREIKGVHWIFDM